MTAVLWSDKEAGAATSGQLQGPAWTAHGVSIDSRTVAAGDLFIALAGPQHDGHGFVADSLAAGAAAALVHRIPDGLSADAPLLVVSDTQVGLNDLAVRARARVDAGIVAVTGSVGKTGTKEMLRVALAAGGATHATTGNLNNQWGVPLSLARMPADVSFGVFELGMNHPGEIRPLSQMVRPQVAIITAVEAVHLAFFASTRQIAEAKAEIFAGVEPGGVVVLPRDNPHYEFLRDSALAAGVTKIRSFGNHITADARLLHGGVDATGTMVFALLGDREIGFRIGIAGRQWAENSLAVLLAIDALGVDPGTATQALASLTAPKGRGERKYLPWGGGMVLMIDESYNASPVSMRASIAMLGTVRPEHGGRRIAVLGDMLELGETAPSLHEGLEKNLRHWAIDRVFVAGPLMRHLYESLPMAMRGGYAVESGELAALVGAAARAGDVIMIKGSAGSRMGRVVQELEAMAAPMRPVANGN
jgi:UDP-N-acetylmuramoyl-tripeptide--D-alanyl-D-alanine ligase